MEKELMELYVSTKAKEDNTAVGFLDGEDLEDEYVYCEYEDSMYSKPMKLILLGYFFVNLSILAFNLLTGLAIGKHLFFTSLAVFGCISILLPGSIKDDARKDTAFLTGMLVAIVSLLMTLYSSF